MILLLLTTYCANSLYAFKPQRKLKDREIDPITLKYRDENKEAQVTQARIEKMMNHTAKVNQMRGQKFNFITHKGPPRLIDTMPRPVNAAPGSDRDRHIISGLTNSAHSQLKTLYDEDFVLNQQRVSTAPRVSVPAQAARRDFNVISNLFFENHEGKEREQYEKMKDHIIKKYWSTHNYDPIKGEYYDEVMQNTYNEQRKILETVQGKAQSLRIPPSILYSDGMSYNILSHEVLDEERMGAFSTTNRRSFNRCKGREIQMKQREAGNLQYEIAQEKQRNRISFKRWETEVDRGYNPFNNTLEVHLPRPQRPATVWSRVHHTGSVGGTTKFAEDNAVNVHQNIDNANSSHATDAAPKTFRNLAGDVNSGPASSPSPIPSSIPLNNRLEANRDHAVVTGHGAMSSRGNNDNFSSRGKPGVGNSSSSRSGNGRAMTAMPSIRVPSLDLSLTEQPQRITYVEPIAGPPGLAVSMVRTGGGLSSMRSK